MKAKIFTNVCLFVYERYTDRAEITQPATGGAIGGITRWRWLRRECKVVGYDPTVPEEKAFGGRL